MEGTTISSDYVVPVARERFWLDLSPHRSDADIEGLAARLDTRFTLKYGEDKLGNGRLDLVSIPWARMPFSIKTQVRGRVEGLLDEALPDWRAEYTLMPFRDNDDLYWVTATAEAVSEDEVAIEESQGEPDSSESARQRMLAAYEEASRRGLYAALRRAVSYKQDGRAWRARKAICPPDEAT
jgi:hypothetical protein